MTSEPAEVSLSKAEDPSQLPACEGVSEASQYPHI